MLALVSDAFGGRGGIAQYNRDFFSAAVAGTAIDAVNILPRFAPDNFILPEKIRQASPGTTRIGYILRALIMAVSGNADIVFCGHINLAPLAALVARLSGAKLIVQVHGIEAWQAPAKYHRLAVESADLVLCVSRYTRGRLLSWAAIDPERVAVLPNTVSEVYSPGDGEALRASWGLVGKTVMLTVARMDVEERYKGHERIIEALSSLPGSVVYVVLGDGNDMDRVKAVAREAGVADRVLFKGHVTKDTLVEAYRMADLYVMPSTGEGFGIAFLEAMASGTPALGLAVAGACDALADGELGMMVPEKNFATGLNDALAILPGSPGVISGGVRDRFGRATFFRCVRGVVEKLLEAA